MLLDVRLDEVLHYTNESKCKFPNEKVLNLFSSGN